MKEWKQGISIITVSKEAISEATMDLLASSHAATFEAAPQNFPVGEPRDASIGRFLEKIHGAGKCVISYHIPYGLDYDVSAPDESIRQHGLSGIRSLLPEARRLGAKMLVLHPSFEPIPREERAKRIGQVRRSLADLTKDLEQYDLRLALENLPRSCMGNCLSEMDEMLSGAGPRIGMCLDTNHLMPPESPAQALRRFGSRIITLHISDYDQTDECHFLPGDHRGKIDWDDFAAALKEVGYTGPCNYECRQYEEPDYTKRLRNLEANFASFLAPKLG